MHQAKMTVKHPNIQVGDHVKIRIKQKSFYKETFNSWSPEVYTVASIDADAPQGALYHLTGYRRPLPRFELKKIEDVQRFAGGELRSALQQVRHPPVAPAPAPVAAAAAVPRPPPPPARRPITRSVAAAAAPLPAAAPVAPPFTAAVAAAAALRRPASRSQTRLI